MRSLVLTTIFSLFLVGCGSSDDNSTVEETKKHVFDAQQQALEKAKNLQKDLDKAAADQLKRIEEATQ